MTDTELIELNKRGFIALDDESEDSFLFRVRHSLNLSEAFTSHASLKEKLKRGINEVTNLYDIAPDWVPLYFDNKSLPFWQGGCAWIFQTEKEGPLSAVIQLRKAFHNKNRYFGLKTDEIIAHELCHVARLNFEEPKYEEFFAYETSNSSFRKKYGPLFQSSYESLLFVFLLLIPLFIDFYFILEGVQLSFIQSIFPKLIPLFYLFYLGYRLVQKRKTFERTKEKLNKYGNNGNFILFRLKDKEIDDFSKMSLTQIENYLIEGAKSSLRLKQLVLSYLGN